MPVPTVPSTRGARAHTPPIAAYHLRGVPTRSGEAGVLSYTSPIAEIMLAPLAPRSDALLQGSSRESLHDLPRGLRLHHHHLAEDLPLASLRGGLGPGLQPAQAGEGEQARLPDLLRRNLGQAVDELRAHRLLQLARSGERLGNRTLGHRLACRLHRLHGSHLSVRCSVRTGAKVWVQKTI